MFFVPAAYVPEDEKEAALLDEDQDGDDSAQEGEEPSAKFLCQDKEYLLKDRPGSADFNDSPAAADFSGQELDSESHLSESSDRMSDFEISSLKNDDAAHMAKDPMNPLLLSSASVLMATANSTAPPSVDNAILSTTGQVADSLEKMKAIYTSFLTNSYWSTLNLNMNMNVTQQPAEKPPRSHSSSSSSSSSSSCGSGAYDWHQTAVAKSLQQATQNHQNRMGMVQQPTAAVNTASVEPHLFSTVQLYRQSTKLYGSIFTGASKFRCKDCSGAYDTLVELTVHMNETGHYRDDNHETDREGTKRWSKPRKRSLLEMEGKEDAQKVLKCMYCGHSFESLQDLSVHMIKTKHYQKVPLKEPVTPVAAKIISAARKRVPIELDLPSSPDSNGGTTPKPNIFTESNDILQKASNPYITANNRYGHQNGASYAWQFESRKSQILKCMECGSSHDTLQELTAHMMVTGHFIKVTNSAIKKGKPIIESPSPAPIAMPIEEKFQSVPLAATTFSPPPAPVPPPTSISPTPMAVVIKKEEKEEECTKEMITNNGNSNTKEKKIAADDETEEKFDISSKYSYLTEEDLDDSPKGGFDILKSLENTVTSAINKAQNGAPSWGGYPSIHAAYQLPNIMKLSLGNSGKSPSLKYMFPGGEILSPTGKIQPLISPPSRQNSPLPKNNFHAMEELVKKVTEKVAKVEEKMREPTGIVRSSPLRRTTPSPCSSEAGDSNRGQSPKKRRGCGSNTPENIAVGLGNGVNHRDSNGDVPIKEGMENGVDSTGVTSPLSTSLCGSTAIITDHPPEQPFVNPLSALQSVMNVHLGKAAKPALPSLDPMSMLFKMSNSLAEKAAVAASTPPSQAKKHGSDHMDRYYYQQHLNTNDQPIDLTKGKSADKSSNGGSLGSVALSSSTSTPTSISPSATITMAKASAAVASFMSNSPLRENALSDISDMLRNLTESQAVSKSSTPTSMSERPDIEGATQEEMEDISPAQKRKGRQSNWNPQHLLILQAQFASSLRQTNDGKYIMSDLSPQERMHISRFTGLSMTTISHWLANVKYQLRRTGGTKFLKNLDSGHPVFFCSDCASQIRSPSTYVSHLESHLGFRLRDLAKLSGEQLLSQISQQHHQQRHTKGLSEKLLSNLSPSSHPLPSSLPTSLPQANSPSPSPEEEGNGAMHQCRLCNRTFASKHAVKLHLSKTHGKSPEDHLMYVCELEK